MEQVLSSAEAARVLGLTPAAVRQLARRGALVPRLVTEGGMRLFRRADVERLAKRRAEERARHGA